MTPVASKVFGMEDQAAFAALSGDWNPLHLDAVAARRTLFGAPVVHGVGGLLWLLGATGPRKAIASLDTRFLRPIRVGDQAEAIREQEDGEASTLAIHSRGRVATRARVAWGGPSRVAPEPRLWPRSTPLDPTFPESAGASGVEPLVWDTAAAAALYGECCPDPGAAAVLSALTRIVGMRLPGLHSLFSGLRLRAGGPVTAVLSYRVTRADARFASLRIGFEGGGFSGELDAFFRPKPVVQAPLETLRTRVDPDEFQGWRFLVVGGSRGLGETAAKLVAAGGGRVCITYRAGQAEAEALVREGAAEAALAFDASSDAWPQLPWPPTHAAFFATPRIELDAASDALPGFRALYVDAFERFARRLALGGEPCRILYPSTVFLETRPPGSEAYCAAKAEGEALCARLASEHPHLRIVAPRIPKTSTDQTAALAGAPAIPAHEVLLPLLRALGSGLHPGAETAG